MKKPYQIYDLPIPDDDHKMAYVMERDKLNFESSKIWIYIGADVKDPTFAKVGMTMSDLSTRSTSTGNSNYFLFCAFQCYHGTSAEQVREIERGAQQYLDYMFGEDKRGRFPETNRPSECYYGINFEDFFFHLHEYLWEHQIRHFPTSCYVSSDDPNWEYGSAISWLFNDIVPLHVRKHYLNLIIK